MSFNFHGVMREIGKYPFAKILIDVAYMHRCVISSLYKAMYYPVMFSNRVVNILSNAVNLMHLCKVI